MMADRHEPFKLAEQLATEMDIEYERGTIVQASTLISIILHALLQLNVRLNRIEQQEDK